MSVWMAVSRLPAASLLGEVACFPWAGRMAVDGRLEFLDAPEQVLLPLAVALLEFLVVSEMLRIYLRVAPSVGCEDLARLPGVPWGSVPS